MEQNVKKELNVVDLWRIFTKNIVLLIIVALVAAALGGTVGGIIAYKSTTYETTLKFSVSPADDTDALLYNLQSEAFAEKLLLDEYGLPNKSMCDPEDYEAALAAIKRYEAARENKKALRKQYNELQVSLIEAQKKYYDDEYTKKYELLDTYKNAYYVDQSHLDMIATLEQELAKISAERFEFMETKYNPVIFERASLQEKYNVASIVVNEARRESKALTEKVLAPWRTNKEVQKKVSDIMNSVVYEYAKLETTEKQDPLIPEEKNKGYVKVYVSTDDKELADFIVAGLKEHVGSFVVKHVEEVTTSVQVDCTLINTFGEPHQIGTKISSNIIKYAVISGVAVLVVAYIVLVFKKMLEMYDEPACNKKGQIESADNTDSE